MRILALMVGAMVAVACGSDDGGDGSAGADASAVECGVNGEGTTAGTVGGETVSPVNSAFSVEIESARVIVVTESEASCSIDEAAGQSVVLLFCDPNLTVGEYTVVSEQAFPDNQACPGDKTAMAIVEDNMTGGDIEDSSSGTITIDGIGDCLSGSFDVTFTDDNSMTGTFSAVRCE